MIVEANNLKRQYSLFAGEYNEAALKCLESGWYIMGPRLKKFEDEWASYIGTKYCVGVASGLDALQIAFRSLNIGAGDEVIVAANAYIACVMGITLNGAIPIFVEPDQYYNIDAQKIEERLTPRTKAILAVHLFGQACDMTKIMDIATKYSLKVVEDCAQSHGNKWLDKKVGSYGNVGCFSFYPTKGCGAFGDGGCITTNNEKIAQNVKVIRNYGSEKKYYNKIIGCNSRLDELQAALLSVKLSHIDELNLERNEVATKYLEEMKNENVILPQVRKNADSTWHQFVVRVKQREKFIAYMTEKGIGTNIHYPVPPYLSEAYRYLGYKKGDFLIAEKQAEEVVSLPIFNGITEEEQDYVIQAVNEFEE